jgi:hypothetical protein
MFPAVFEDVIEIQHSENGTKLTPRTNSTQGCKDTIACYG